MAAEPRSKKNRVLIGDKWYWRFSRTIDGQKMQFYGKTKTEAEAKIQVAQESHRLTRERTFGQLLEWWIDSIYKQDTSLSEGTKALHLAAYHNIFDSSPLLGRSIQEVIGADIQKAFSDSGVGATTQRHCRSFLRRFYKYMIAQSVINTDATASLIVPEAKHKRRDQSVEIFSEEELRRFLDETPKDHRLRLLVVLAIYSGCRVSELLSLRYPDVESGHIRVSRALKEIPPIEGSGKTQLIIDKTKTASSVRSIPIENEAVKKAIRYHKGWHKREMLRNNYRSEYIFTTESGSLYYLSTIRTAYKRLCSSLGIEYKSFQCFRHSFGSRLASQGVPIETVSKLMGHDDIRVTAKYYINVSDDTKRDAVAKLAL